ncbi:MAG: DUF302 domain-containing protein [Deltaproteobacteria bacterium]
MTYYLSKIVDLPFDDAVDAVTKSLGEQGFGILTEIDVQATLNKKLDVDFRKYKILGACNPRFAYKALEVEDKIGVMLPCNVIVQETPDGKVEVAAMDPAAVMDTIPNRALVKIAHNVRERLEAALKDL